MPITLLLDLRSIVCRIRLLALRLVCSIEHWTYYNTFSVAIQNWKGNRWHFSYNLQTTIIDKSRNQNTNFLLQTFLSIVFSNLKFCCIICILHFYFHFDEHAPPMKPTCQTVFDYIYIYWINERWTGIKQ